MPASLQLPSPLSERYLARRVLGSGGFGTVLLAEDRELARPVAIKLLRGSLPELADRLRFEREAQLTAALSHPHVVRVFDFGVVDDGTSWIVYQYLEGETLSALARQGPVDAESLAAWAQQLASALAEVHARGLVHRDVKPDNVMVVAGSAVLCDFGLARAAGHGGQVTAEGLILGTPAFMAPELFQGQDASPASDQFGLAATLYFLRYQQTVYGTARVGEIVAGLAGWRPKIPPNEAVDGPEEGALTRALAPHPAARFPGVDSFAEAFSGGAPTAPSGPAVGHPVTAHLAPPNPAPSARPRGLMPYVLGAGLFLGGLWLGRNLPASARSPTPPTSVERGAPSPELLELGATIDDELRSIGIADHLTSGSAAGPDVLAATEALLEKVARWLDLHSTSGSPALTESEVRRLLSALVILPRNLSYQLRKEISSPDVLERILGTTAPKAGPQAIDTDARLQAFLASLHGRLRERLGRSPWWLDLSAFAIEEGRGIWNAQSVDRVLSMLEAGLPGMAEVLASRILQNQLVIATEKIPCDEVRPWLDRSTSYLDGAYQDVSESERLEALTHWARRGRDLDKHCPGLFGPLAVRLEALARRAAEGSPNPNWGFLIRELRALTQGTDRGTTPGDLRPR